MASDPASEILNEAKKRFPGLAGRVGFITAMLAALAIGYFIKDRLASETISGLTAKNDAQSAEINLYKAKLQVGSPDEALKKFAELEKKIDDLRPKFERRLSDQQKRDLTAALAPIVKQIVPGLVITTEGTPEQGRYANEFVVLFKKLGLETLGPITGFSTSETDRGVMVGLKKPENPSDLALKFIDALRRSGLEVRTIQWEGPVAANFPIDFDLFIGPNRN
jgi:hypothetical protein